MEDGVVAFSDQGNVSAVNTTFLRMTNLQAKELNGISGQQFDKMLERITRRDIYYSLANQLERKLYYLDDKSTDSNCQNSNNQLLDNENISLLVVNRIDKNEGLPDSLAKLFS